MTEPIEIIINPKKQLLRLSCGQCGDTKDIILELDPECDEKIIVGIIDSEDLTTTGEGTAMLMQPIHLII